VTRAYFGSGTDDLITGDYNGDGTADIAIRQSSNGLWAIRNISRIYFGSSSDVPLAAGGSVQQTVLKTGQTTSYRTGDDGDLQKGREVLHDNGDGTVTDLRTGLMWPKDGTGAGYANGAEKTWNDAIDWANGLDFAGHTDWRLPNANELKSFQEVTWGHYQSQSPDYYWSSTTLASNTSAAVLVSLRNGFTDADGKTMDKHVVAVRGGN